MVFLWSVTVRDYEVHTRCKKTGQSKGWKKIGELSTHALYWLRDDCDWSLGAPNTVARNDASSDDVRMRVDIEITARALEGRL